MQWIRDMRDSLLIIVSLAITSRDVVGDGYTKIIGPKEPLSHVEYKGGVERVEE